MKCLIVTRHAKSSWDDPSLKDIERPLNPRGLKAAPKIGRALKEKNLIPDTIHTSPAQRTRQTAHLISEQLSLEPSRTKIIPQFYGTSVSEVIHHLTSQCQSTIMLIGHNPCWTELCNYLTDIQLTNLPTAGTLIIHFPLQTWDQLPELLAKRQKKTIHHTLLLPRHL